jgi:hypothetical protein
VDSQLRRNATDRLGFGTARQQQLGDDAARPQHAVGVGEDH